MGQEAAVQRSGGAAKWLVGCAVGCLVVFVLIVVAGGVAGYFGMRYMNAEGKREFLRVFNEEYERWKSDGKVPETYVADYDALIEVAQREEATFWTASLVTGLVQQTLFEDGAVSEQEGKLVRGILSELQANPALGVKDMQGVIERNAGMKEHLEALQDSAGGPASVWGWTPPPPEAQNGPAESAP